MKLINNSKARMFCAMCAVFVLGSVAASARNIDDYSVIMPRFGSTVMTGKLLKTSQTRGVNNNTSIGGNYSMKCAIYKSGTTSKLTSEKTVGSGDRVYLNYNSPSSAKGMNVQMGCKTGLSTTVNVQASGSWSPDEE